MDRPVTFKFAMGERLRKKSGSSWQGRVVGFYTTKLTPEGYAIESERERGSVQIYPVAALEARKESELRGAAPEVVSEDEAERYHIDLFRIIRAAGRRDLEKAEAAAKYVAGELVRLTGERDRQYDENVSLIARVGRLSGALEKAAEWFREYALQHGSKACSAPSEEEAQSRLDKAKRNHDRADELEAALNPENTHG